MIWQRLLSAVRRRPPGNDAYRRLLVDLATIDVDPVMSLTMRIDPGAVLGIIQDRAQRELQREFGVQK